MGIRFWLDLGYWSESGCYYLYSVPLSIDRIITPLLRSPPIHRRSSSMALLPPSPATTSSHRPPCWVGEDYNGYGDHRTLSILEAQSIRKKAAAQDLLSHKKLVLVLDLDNTLLHSIDATADNDYHHRLNNPTSTAKDIFEWSTVDAEEVRIITKLRPFVHDFLKQASKLFDLHIYTMGTHLYAHGISDILDPNGTYFENPDYSFKIFSREDCTRPNKKSLHVMPRADERITVVVDDREDVWEDHRGNVIHIKPYNFLDHSCSDDEDVAGGMLATVLDLLVDVHGLFFDPDLSSPLSLRDVRLVLKSIRELVLEGCTIALDYWLLPSQGAASVGKTIWEMAQELGATCCSMDREEAANVTHVVSSSIRFEVARQAAKNDRFFVSTRWVEEAYYSWRRPREEEFLLIR